MPPGNNMPFEEDCDFMVIGIDFGTTYSGASWATFEGLANNQVNIVTTWPGSGREEGKVPTELFYEDDQMMWGYEIPHDAEPVRWFKLLLLKEEDLDGDMRSNEFILRGRRLLRENDKSAIELVTDYLRALWTYVLASIKKARGAAVVDALAFHVVITVPAIWKGYVRQAMEKAAKNAGILQRRVAGRTTLSLVPEPEAAALSTLYEPGRRVRLDEVYIICDAGGGTVDLISYKISAVNPIALEEAVEGTGGLCGGIFIDDAFERMCKARLGRRWDRLSKAGIREIMREEWEHAIKPQFKGKNSTREYIVRIPAEAFVKSSLDDVSRQPFIKNGRIHFSSSHIQGSFTEVFAKIDALIEEQLQRANRQSILVSGIVLVGGLGGSPYLYDHLHDRHVDAGISVLQAGGMRPRTAIARGAVIKGFIDKMKTDSEETADDDVGINALEQSARSLVLYDKFIAPQVTSTVARFNIGRNYMKEYNESIHIPEDKVWSEEYGKWMVNDQMKWFVKRGDNVAGRNSELHKFFWVSRRQPMKVLRIDLYQCADEVPPSRGVGMRPLCTISCPIHASMIVDWKNGTGKLVKRLSYDLKMIPSGASVEFEIYIDGRRQGTTGVQIDFK
ncbi:actin-like ATPase domain-containing protein [Lophiostoma macrostomum CBS 122681]|uniref:Actin-like ATPase domain-containing protein n=1 Tax=Lophiostoma macrostomum CBS 122681 TaxID=1314788 RepID=A0A6A6SPG8_9PLEO|nr:actin-like ATPase domain-containing protein [Lophiostoma macrostomum CBS 122681]